SPIRQPEFENRFPVSMEEYDALKVTARELTEIPLAEGAPDIQSDEEAPPIVGNPPEDGGNGAAGPALAPASLLSFDAIPQTAFRPPDPTLAVGPNDVMVAVNVDLVGYNKSGVQTFRWANFTAMFNPVLPQGAQMFDPKLTYDHYAGRWIVCIAARR